jgi:RHS repeat-associated protein
MNFQGIYETQRQVSQLINGSQSLLRQWTTCYNGNTSNCNSTAITLPITQRNINDQYGSTGLQCQHNYFYNPVGGLTEQDDYDYPSGTTLLRETLVTYASLPPNITAFRQQVTVKNGSGTTVSQTNYNYDENTPGSTSSWGITQHASVSGSRGNLTSINYPVSGLTAHFTYYDTGVINTSQDVNTATTTYNYSPTNNAFCNGAFSTSISEPLNMSRSMTWNCTGGVLTSLTDENNQVTSTTYDDAYFWRPRIVTDQLGYQTNLYYGGPNLVTPWLKFNNNNSVTSVAHNSDGLGRPAFDQRYQSPTAQTYDTVSYTYDANGRPYSTTMPCAVGYGLNCPGGTPKTTQTYDALNRPLQFTDGGGGTITYTYSQNDVLVTVGPAPSGENTKRRQLEYNALGQLTSVCELTSAAGSGACGQNSPQTGYWTTYTYDALGDLKVVSQNAQPGGTAQPRNYSYDAMSRLTSETNPENGTTTYSYDTDSTCSLNFPGDLVRTYDANGNTTCYSYDALHRVTWVKYPSGPNAANSYAKFFWYDAPYSNNTSSTANLKGRLSAAGTCTTPTGSVNTHSQTHYEYAYDGDGRMTDVWQQTPNSGGIYHTTATSWPNGALASLSGIPGQPTFTFGVDGEGRNNSASQGTTGLVSSVLFNPASQVTYIGFANGDHDDYQYGPNTSRETQYSFTVGATPQTETGTLTWNANGTLEQLAISDPFNSSDNQTCTYGYDDLVRVSNANCGSAWSQTFSYDAFGNITKSGTSMWQPGYNTATNQYLPGSGSSYDANGNLLSDPSNTYTWNADGQPLTIGTRALTYDAFGQTVERSTSGTYDWSAIYTPIGRAAYGQGQSFDYLELGLPGGTRMLVCNTCTQQYFSHRDWQGSTRLMSNVGPRTVAGTQAYAPFGELYAVSGTVEDAFAGIVTDTVIGLYDAAARRVNAGQGRWITPDPAGLAAVDPTNPQSWNRYAYVRNAPLTLTDPTGLGPSCFVANCSDGGGFGCSEDGIAVNCGMVGTNGNTIFDAVRGAPGTYLSFDMYGNLTFGFSYDAYAAILANDPFASNSSRGWTYIINSFGASGTTAMLFDTLEQRQWLQANLPANAPLGDITDFITINNPLSNFGQAVRQGILTWMMGSTFDSATQQFTPNESYLWLFSYLVNYYTYSNTLSNIMNRP